MKLLSRTLQHQLLEVLADAYPRTIDQGELQAVASDQQFTANLSYLHEHGLVESKLQTYLSGPPVVTSARITARGIDFLADDGGLGAILGVMTVRLHEDTVRELLIHRVAQSPADESTKRQLISQLKKLPAEGVSKLAQAAIESGLKHIPDAVHWVQHVLS